MAAPISSSLGVDVSPVRVHTDSGAADASKSLSARAFTFGSHVFLGAGERPTDLGLMAHEVSHVVQQQAAGPRVQLFTPGGADPLEREAHRASTAVVDRQPFAVSGRAQPRVQRLGLSDVRDKFADWANVIPGYRMLTILIGINPINMQTVPKTPANIFRALIEFIPGGGLVTKALDNYGIFDKIANWVGQQVSALGMAAGMFIDAIKTFISGLKLSDVFHLGAVWDRAKAIFTGPIDKLISFAKGLIVGIITFIKDAILMPLAKLAEGTRGWDLLIAVLGRNPITGAAVPRTAETLIPGFLKLIGQEDVWQNMQQANALGRAWAWFQGAMAALMGFVGQIPALFITTLKSLTLEDIILVPLAFAKVGKVFGNFIGDFISWGLKAVWNLLEIIFDVVSPGALGYIKKTGAAIKSIFKNPLPFVGNLVKAAKLGFSNFAGNFGTHLKAGLIDWLTGSLPGIYIPKGFTLSEIAKFVFSVLGLTWANIRQKLVKATSETAVKAMEIGFDIVKTLVTGGAAAAWEKIKEQLSNLKDMAIGAITDFVIDMVAKKAIPKLVSMFIPGAGFISAILSIYDTVMVFVNKIKTIIQVVTGFIDSIVAIAAGAIGTAASKVEGILARLLSLAINFLAGFAGLGKVADKIMGIVQKIRAPIDKAIDWLIGFLVKMAKAAGRFLAQAGTPQDPQARLRAGLSAAVSTVNALRGPSMTEALINPALAVVKVRYGFKTLRPVVSGGDWWIEGEINPSSRAKTAQRSGESAGEELTEQSVWEHTAERVPATPAPEISLSPSSLSFTTTVLEHVITASPATAARKATVRALVAARLQTAETSRDPHAAYVALQQAAGIVNSLYSGSRPVVVIHHEQEVAEHPETFVETRRGRIYVSRGLRAQVATRVQQAHSLTAAQRREREAELIDLIRRQIQDDETTALARPLDEIDLIAFTERAHVEVHRRRRGGR